MVDHLPVSLVFLVKWRLRLRYRMIMDGVSAQAKIAAIGTLMLRTILVRPPNFLSAGGLVGTNVSVVVDCPV